MLFRSVVRLSPKGWKTPINDDDLPKTDSTRFLKFEGLPAQTHWALLPVLLDHKLKVTFRATATTELEAYLFDYRKEQLVWHDKSIGSNMQGVLFGWEAEIRAKNEATDFLTNSIPTKINKTKASYR